MDIIYKSANNNNVVRHNILMIDSKFIIFYISLSLHHKWVEICWDEGFGT